MNFWTKIKKESSVLCTTKNKITTGARAFHNLKRSAGRGAGGGATTRSAASGEEIGGIAAAGEGAAGSTVGSLG